MIQNILVPLDGSDNANVALEVAADLAAKYGAKLKLLHVGQRQPGPLLDLHAAAERSFAEAERAGTWTSDHDEWPRHLQVLDHMGHMILEQGQSRALALGASELETKVDWGDESERILHHSRHPPVDMIVMGSRGVSPLEGLFLGSVSHKVFYRADCTCVTVHARQTGALAPAGLGRPKVILIAYDGSDHAVKALELGCDLAEKTGAGLKLLHVLQPGISPEQLLQAVDLDQLDQRTRRALDDARSAGSLTTGSVFVSPPIPGHALEKIAELILQPAKETAARHGISQVETEILDGDPAACILAAAKADGAGLIVMGMRGFGEIAGLLIGSVSYKVNHLAPCTCIIVR